MDTPSTSSSTNPVSPDSGKFTNQQRGDILSLVELGHSLGFTFLDQCLGRSKSLLIVVSRQMNLFCLNLILKEEEAIAAYNAADRDIARAANMLIERWLYMEH